MIKNSIKAFAAMLLMAGGLATAQPYQEGTNYRQLEKPVRTAVAGKIEVAEVFWYGCPHCFNFEPIFNSWKKDLGDDVNVVMLPAVFSKVHEAHAKLYFIAKHMKVEDQARMAIYKEIMAKRGRALTDVDSQVEFMSQYNIDEAKYRKMYDSFYINNQINMAKAKIMGYQVTGTPDVIVNGKYRIEGFKTQEERLAIAKHLIEMERAAAK